MKFKRNYYGYLYILPLVLVLATVLLYPIIRVAVMSVQDWYMLRPSSKGEFVGLNNFITLFKDDAFWKSVKTSVIYILVTVPCRYLLGFGAALLLNQKFRGRGVARALIIIPWAIPEVVICLIWILMYERDFGIINALLSKFGIISENIGFLMNPDTALGAAMVVNVWKGFPFVGVMLLAGMQSIPGELYEASMVDGSNAFQRLRHITIPMLRPVSMVVFLLLVIWTIRDFGIVYLLARGGPTGATEVLTIYLYKAAFTSNDYGIASAGGMIMLVVAMIFTYFYIRTLNREEGKA